MFAGAAEARPTRAFCGQTNDGTEYCVKPVGSTAVQSTLDNKFDRTGFTANMDCATGKLQWRNNDGYTEAQMRDWMTFACRN